MNRIFYLFISYLTLFNSFSSSLKIFKNVLNSSSLGKPIIYEHTVASFGPQHFNITAQLFLFSPRNGCSPPPSSSIFTNKIVIIERGGCYFSDKAFHAQQSGAIGMIVAGRDNDYQRWVVMHKNKHDSRTIHIASIYIPFDEYRSILHFMNKNKKTTYGMLDSVGKRLVENSDTTPAALVFLVVLACFGAAAISVFVIVSICYVYRACKRRQRRRRMVRHIKVIRYRKKKKNKEKIAVGDNSDDGKDKKEEEEDEEEEGEEEKREEVCGLKNKEEKGEEDDGLEQVLINSGDNTTTTTKKKKKKKEKEEIKPINCDCAVCLEDFEDREHVKLLPCFHAFHPVCIDQWLSDYSELCPICKQSITIKH